MRYKFRQAICFNGKFSSWHFWGFLDGAFFGPYHSGEVTVEIAEKESQQFTGLQDKHGVDIYQKDSVKADHPDALFTYKGVVTWDSELAYYKIVWDQDGLKYECPMYEFEEFEIIGNVHEHEHPELKASEL